MLDKNYLPYLENDCVNSIQLNIYEILFACQLFCYK
jgi:hypothetical protein